jgi:hypothetical protein
MPRTVSKRISKKLLNTGTHQICLAEYLLLVRSFHDIYDGFKRCSSDFLPSCSVIVCEVVELVTFYAQICSYSFVQSNFVIQLIGKY